MCWKCKASLIGALWRRIVRGGKIITIVICSACGTYNEIGPDQASPEIDARPTYEITSNLSTSTAPAAYWNYPYSSGST